ncbi:MAG: hypothetical protein JO301_12825 [Chitinophagaceae bacterium]|nr:hypothetical protein [Chitinophagaceae bacterium]
MPESYQNLTEPELIDRLTELSEKMAQARGISTAYDSLKEEILAVQEEIEARKKPVKKKWRFL